MNRPKRPKNPRKPKTNRQKKSQRQRQSQNNYLFTTTLTPAKILPPWTRVKHPPPQGDHQIVKGVGVGIDRVFVGTRASVLNYILRGYRNALCCPKVGLQIRNGKPRRCRHGDAPSRKCYDPHVQWLKSWKVKKLKSSKRWEVQRDGDGGIMINKSVFWFSIFFCFKSTVERRLKKK